MILNGIKNSVLAVVLTLITTASFAQETAGRIVFERKTNLKKLFKDNKRVRPFLKDGVTWKIEQFELYFNDSSSAFLPIEGDDAEEGMMKFLTTHNTIYKNYRKNEKLCVLDMWGTETYIKDSILPRKWKVTESKRNIGGYQCRKAMWEMNDSTRIYAWFTVDLVPSIGPEGFDGLPGAILGLATENGSIIYFAKEVEIIEPDPSKFVKDMKGKDVFTVAELKKRILQKMGQWVKEDDLNAMFSWL